MNLDEATASGISINIMRRLGTLCVYVAVRVSLFMLYTHTLKEREIY